MTTVLTERPRPETTSTTGPVPQATHETRMPGLRRIGSVLGVRWASPVVLVALWQLASFVGLLPERVLPAPQLVLESAWDLVVTGQLGSAMLVSTSRVAQGLALGVVSGVVLGIVVGGSRVAEVVVDPPLQMLRALPHLGLIPLFILWFGIGETPKVLLIALGAFFPIYLNVASAFAQIDPRLLEVATVFGFSRRQRLVDVILPSVAPQSLVGLRQSLAVAWLTLIVAEQVNATEGIGFLVMNARDFLRVDVILVGLVVYSLLGLATDTAVRGLERRVLRHRA